MHDPGLVPWAADSLPEALDLHQTHAEVASLLAPGQGHNRGPMDAPDKPHRSPIRSFVLRAGRMGSGQVRALAELGPRFVLPLSLIHI